MVEILDGASYFAFGHLGKVEFLGKFILDKLPSGQVTQKWRAQTLLTICNVL